MHHARTGQGSNHLHGLAIDRRKGGAQGFMTLDQLVEALLQSLPVQPSLQAQRQRDIIKGAVGVQLSQEPQTLLSKRERQVSRAGYGKQRWGNFVYSRGRACPSPG